MSLLISDISWLSNFSFFKPPSFPNLSPWMPDYKVVRRNLQNQASHPPPTAATQPPHPHDPKGKAPLTSPTPSHHSSSHHTHQSTGFPQPQPSQPAPQITPPHPSLPTATPHSPSLHPQPGSPSSPHSHASSSPHFELVARTPQVQTPSSDSEATQSASPPSPTLPLPSPDSAPTKFASASYQRRKKPAIHPDS